MLWAVGVLGCPWPPDLPCLYPAHAAPVPAAGPVSAPWVPGHPLPGQRDPPLPTEPRVHVGLGVPGLQPVTTTTPRRAPLHRCSCWQSPAALLRGSGAAALAGGPSCWR